MMREMFKSLQLLSATLLMWAKKAAEKAKPYAKLYVRVLLIVAMVAILTPIPFLVIGIVKDLRWLTALALVWWTLWTALLIILVAPIGLFVEILTGGVQGSGQRYVRRVGDFLLVGLCISFFASLLPLGANPGAIPLICVAALILGLLRAKIFKPTVVSWVVTILFLAIILSYFLPTVFRTAGEKIAALDIGVAQPKRLEVTYADVESHRIIFFRPDGKPQVWYYRNRDGTYELFDKGGHHPINNEELRPVISDLVPHIIEQLKVDSEKERMGYQRPAQGMHGSAEAGRPPVGPEYSQGQVTGPAQADLTRRKSAPIQPAEATGEVNRPVTPDIVKRDTSIKPDYNEAEVAQKPKK